jgi:ADP-ribose pyrophosphatase YjhB (NUDIX family)
MKSLAKKEREAIFQLFLDKYRLRFSEIEKCLNDETRLSIRSNMVAYHLEQMRKEGLLEKQGEHYALTKEAERYIPVFSHITGKNLSPLPVVLVAPVRNSKVFLIKREKRPYKGYWSLIGGKMLHAESFDDACARLLREKAGLAATKPRLNAIAHERVEDGGKVKHSFLLFFMRTSVKPDARPARGTKRTQDAAKEGWFSVRELKAMKVIHSDRWLIEHKLGTDIAVQHVLMQENDGELSSFRVK